MRDARVLVPFLLLVSPFDALQPYTPVDVPHLITGFALKLKALVSTLDAINKCHNSKPTSTLDGPMEPSVAWRYVQNAFTTCRFFLHRFYFAHSANTINALCNHSSP